MVFSPAGPVARMEQRLIIISMILTAVVVIPVLILLWYIVRRYRDVPDNTAPYHPEWSESRTLEVLWWGVPIVIIAILGVFTARDTFALTRPPEPTTTTPLTVEVTSLDWKWLFEYPGQNVATVNYCKIPANRPVQFVLTSDAPMNSFWVPQLGGQEYTMPGMAMKLWLQADHPGTYYGRGANFSGEGFANMTFHVIAVPESQFDAWVKGVKKTAPPLTEATYNHLVQPSVEKEMTFSSYPPSLFTDTIRKEGGMYMKRDLTVIHEKES
ncbi:ubiquinol oxidase subunit II [Alicyclobacillus cycloheptanicus]|nr:ubiquinol oxidase subunit II [Alicyclobacillus cycloheptanicus]